MTKITVVIFHWDAGEWNWMCKVPSLRLLHALKTPHTELSIENRSKIFWDFTQQGARFPVE